MTEVALLEVRLRGRRIGTLTRLPGDAVLFAFDEAYIEDGQRPTLSLSFKAADGGLVTDIRPVRSRVPPFFSNLLPEGPLRDYLAARAGVHPNREFFLLWVLGRDLPGAVTLEPLEGEPGPVNPPDESPGKAGALRFSLAGVQLKLSALEAATGGLTIPAGGMGGDWILKLPSARFPGVPENEYVMMRLARAVGIDVPDVRLLPLEAVGGLPTDLGNLQGQALAVRRFDRAAGGARIHTEDFAQVFGVYPERKYERASYRNIAEVLWTETGEVGALEFIRRLVFSVLIGNADMHLKNWSLIYEDERTPALAPAYDLVNTIAFLPDDRLALSLEKSKRIADISLERFRRMARRVGIPTRRAEETVRETVGRFLEQWREGDWRGLLPRRVAQRIDDHLAGLPLAGGKAPCRGGG